MSGGSYNYAYCKVSAFIDELRHNVAGRRKDAQTDPENIWNQEAHQVLRERFADHLEKVMAAMKEIEWVDSGDCGPGDEVEAINEVLTSE